MRCRLIVVCALLGAAACTGGEGTMRMGDAAVADARRDGEVPDARDGGNDSSPMNDGAPMNDARADGGADATTVDGDAPDASGRMPGTTPETALELEADDDGDIFTGTFGDPESFEIMTHWFRVPYTRRGEYGVIIRKLEGSTSMEVMVTPDTMPAFLNEGSRPDLPINGCRTGDAIGCGHGIDFDYLPTPPEYAYLRVGAWFASEYSLELVKLAELRDPPVTPPAGYVRISTVREALVGETGTEITYGMPRTEVEAMAGAEAGNPIYFAHLGVEGATCWIRDDEGYEDRVSEDVMRVTWQTPTRPLLFLEPPTRGARVSYGFDGAAYASGEMGTLGIQLSGEAEIAYAMTPTPTFTASPTIELAGGAIRHDYSAFADADEWYLRFITAGFVLRRVIECRLPIDVPAVSDIAALTAAMGRDFQARGVRTSEIDVGVCKREGAGRWVPGMTLSEEVTELGLAMCDILRLPTTTLERGF